MTAIDRELISSWQSKDRKESGTKCHPRMLYFKHTPKYPMIVVIRCSLSIASNFATWQLVNINLNKHGTSFQTLQLCVQRQEISYQLCVHLSTPNLIAA